MQEWLSLAISTAGFVAVVASLLLFMRQTRDLARQTSFIAHSARQGAFDRVQAQMFVIDQLFVTYPELRPYFHEELPLPADDEILRQRLLAAAGTILDVFEVVVLQRQYLSAAWPSGSWERYMAQLFAHSRILRDYLESGTEWYSPELVDLLRESYADQPTIEPVAR